MPLSRAAALVAVMTCAACMLSAQGLFSPESRFAEKQTAARDLCLPDAFDDEHPPPLGDWTLSARGPTASALHHLTHAPEGATHAGEALPEVMRRIYAHDIMLSEAALAESVSSLGDVRRLRAVARKLVTGQPIKAVVLGGSVSMGHGARTRRGGYVSRLFAWIEQAVPHAQHELLNRAIPAVTSSYVCPCVTDLVPPDADLVLLEFTFNDFTYGTHKLEDPIPRSFERLLRKVLRLPGRPAVVYLHYWGGRYFKWSYLANAVEDLYDTLLKYYGLTGLSMRQAAHGLRVRNASAAAELFRPEWHPDDIHPSCVGHRFLADMLIGHLQDLAAAELLAHWLAGGDGRRLSHAEEAASGLSLRPPLQTGNEGDRFEQCITEPAAVQPLVRNIQGFEWHDEGRRKFGAVGWRVGDTLELDVPVAGRRRQLTLGVGFLTSYEHMGQAAVACVAGCACVRREFSLLHPERMSITLWRVVEATLEEGAATCVLRVTTLPRTASGEHKVKVTSLMVSEEPGFVMTWLNCDECAQ